MNFKYFLRGLGAGIVFTAIVMLTAYMTSGEYKLSDEEIIKKAEALGMVQAEEIPIVKDTGSEEALSTEKTEATTTEAALSTEELIIDASTEEPDTAEATTESTTEAAMEPVTTEATTEAATTEVANGQLVKATITVQAGMGSYEVAVLLKDAGIIKDANDFDAYLIKNGYSTKIRIKSQEFNSNMSYEEIAKLLVKE